MRIHRPSHKWHGKASKTDHAHSSVVEGDCGITRPLYDVDEKKSDKRQIINIC